jgi:hypothetical protein
VPSKPTSVVVSIKLAIPGEMAAVEAPGEPTATAMPLLTPDGLTSVITPYAAEAAVTESIMRDITIRTMVASRRTIETSRSLEKLRQEADHILAAAGCLDLET